MGDDWNDDPDTAVAETSAIATAELPEINLFGRWSCDEVNVSDMSLQVKSTIHSDETFIRVCLLTSNKV